MSKIRLALIIGVFLLIIIAILIYHQSYIAAFAMLAVLVASLEVINKIKE